MTQILGYGVDLSHWQVPDLQPWHTWLGQVDFALIRASYGRTKDDSATKHVQHTRDIGAKVGLYEFFRVVEDIDAQVDTLRAVSDACGIDGRDIVPSIDIEADGTHRVEPSWSGPAEELTGKLCDRFGGVQLYITQADWRALGSPAWVLRHDLWSAHWGVEAPATPGGLPCTVHQHRVGPFVRNGAPGVFDREGNHVKPGEASWGWDQNRQLKPFRFVGQVVTLEESEAIENRVAAFLTAERDRFAAEPFPLQDEEKIS